MWGSQFCFKKQPLEVTVDKQSTQAGCQRPSFTNAYNDADEIRRKENCVRARNVDEKIAETIPKKRRRGKLGEICQLNLDVLFLVPIAAYIHLIDLARTCKSLRQLLMDRSSAFVWKTARHQVDDLPDCPADLTEQECVAGIVWIIAESKGLEFTKKMRFCSLSSCHEVIRKNKVVATEHVTVGGGMEYYHSSDEQQFLRDKEGQYAICQHARQCEKWQRRKAAKYQFHLRVRRRERDKSILERLKQLGYAREIAYFRPFTIESSCKALFGKAKLLTDKELSVLDIIKWVWIWPESVGTMNSFRSQRLEEVVYHPDATHWCPHTPTT
ncbi:hypothetical protein OG21DRAFT_1527516 [Imleria badia]|nr:hypothetical protein OG21DRAFT_1527516 [Imleria badia]